MLNKEDIREIIDLIDKSSISEFNYEADGASISMKKSTSSSVPHEKEIPAAEQRKTQAVVEETQEKEVTTASDEPETNAAKSKFDEEIVAPMVGTFYSRPAPENDAFVTVGSPVGEDTVVCIVEAMKLFNEIEAETSGEIVEILAEDGELVEYGQPLFRVKK